MVDVDEDKILTRISVAGMRQLPSFTGAESDYSYVSYVTFRGQRDGKTIKLIGLRRNRWMGKEPVFCQTEEYEPRKVNSFFSALDSVLEEEGWFLGYVTSQDTTAFREHQRITGALYSRKDREKDRETEP